VFWEPPYQKVLAPSVLGGNHADLRGRLATITASGIHWIHLDIMDGHFVPNLSFGPQSVADLRPQAPEAFFDVHLMLDNPDAFVELFAEAGADLISIHLEPDYAIEETLEKIGQLGKRKGVVLNPGTPAKAALPYLNMVDLVLVMTVWPGFGGQSFIEDTLPKMRQLSQWREEKNLLFRLEVDGGIDARTAPLCHNCGVDTFVAGSAFFKAEDKKAFRRAIELNEQ